MLKEFKIKNYKRITDNGVAFENLSYINYLVGENGSGKSSVLDFLYEEYKNRAVSIKDSLTSVELLDQVNFKKTCSLGSNSEKWRDLFLDLLEKKNIVVLDLLGYAISLMNTKKAWKILDSEVLDQTFYILNSVGIVENMEEFEFEISNKFESEQLTGGIDKLINLVYSILYTYKVKKNPFVLINEPATHLHPSWQKKLPIIFNQLIMMVKIQIFVATHSPFIISSAGDLTDDSNTQVKNCKILEKPVQKVYFLRDGRNASKSGNVSSKGKNGYWGRKVTFISSQMLGAGLMDLVSPQEAIISDDAPVFVMCEGEGLEEDAKIYNIIFNDRIPTVMFVSCRGSSQVYKTFQLLRDIKPGLSADFEMLMVRDRDHEFPDITDIHRYEEINQGSKVLRKRAIEIYIFNSETANLLLKKFGKKLSNKNKIRMDNLHNEIQIETERGIPGNSYKDRLIDLFNIITNGFGNRFLPRTNYSLMEKIATLINPKTKTYGQLEKNIFE